MVPILNYLYICPILPVNTATGNSISISCHSGLSSQFGFLSSKIRANTVGFGWMHSSFPGRFLVFLGSGALKGETDA